MNVKTTFLYLVLITFIAFSCGPSAEELEQERIETAYQDSLKQAKQLEEDRLTALKLDSLKTYIHMSDSLVNKHKWKNAAFYLDSALALSSHSGEDSLIEKRAELHFKAQDYALAVDDYSVLLDRSINRSENLYNRAVCYQKQQKIQLAVDDLKEAIELGNEDAEKLHEKINPERKRIAYYVTRCWDGSTSNASGRGACSHHGGVKNWNEPVYETYRKY